LFRCNRLRSGAHIIRVDGGRRCVPGPWLTCKEILPPARTARRAASATWPPYAVNVCGVPETGAPAGAAVDQYERGQMPKRSPKVSKF
jgi:hypothetical protein